MSQILFKNMFTILLLGKNLRLFAESHSGISSDLSAATRLSLIHSFVDQLMKISKTTKYPKKETQKTCGNFNVIAKKSSLVEFFNKVFFSCQVYNGILISNGETVQNIAHLKVTLKNHRQ